MTRPFKRGDLVVPAGGCVPIETDRDGFPVCLVGLVRRVAIDGSWVDVWWRAKDESWSKRMKTDALEMWQEFLPGIHEEQC